MRWKQGPSRPSTRHMMALLELTENLGLRHLLTGPTSVTAVGTGPEDHR